MVAGPRPNTASPLAARSSSSGIESLRIVAEPSGATGLAALMSGAYKPAPGERVATLICGANTGLAGFGLPGIGGDRCGELGRALQRVRQRPDQLRSGRGQELGNLLQADLGLAFGNQ